jgi:hypothetical protein
MSNVTLTIAINRFTHLSALDSLSAGGYRRSFKDLDECHLGLTVENTSIERGFLKLTIEALLAYEIPFTIAYHQ